MCRASATEKARETIAKAAATSDRASDDVAEAYLVLGDAESAEEASDAMLRKAPRDLRAIANKGMLVAMRAGKAASTGEAVRLVNESFSYLDRAVSLAESRQESLDAALAWSAWAQIAISMPEIPFGKTRTGAYYFQKAAAWYAAHPEACPDSAARAASCLYLSAQALETVHSPAEAEALYLRAASQKGLGARVRLELAKKGFE